MMQTQLLAASLGLDLHMLAAQSNLIELLCKQQQQQHKPQQPQHSHIQQQQDQINSGASQQNANRYKTELCRSYQENGVCKYGEKCQFAHGPAEMRNMLRHPKYKTELCRTFHATGYCPYGPRCHFVHDTHEVTAATTRKEPSKSIGITANKTQASSASSSQSVSPNGHHFDRVEVDVATQVSVGSRASSLLTFAAPLQSQQRRMDPIGGNHKASTRLGSVDSAFESVSPASSRSLSPDSAFQPAQMHHSATNDLFYSMLGQSRAFEVSPSSVFSSSVSSVSSLSEFSGSIGGGSQDLIVNQILNQIYMSGSGQNEGYLSSLLI